MGLLPQYKNHLGLEVPNFVRIHSRCELDVHVSVVRTPEASYRHPFWGIPNAPAVQRPFTMSSAISSPATRREPPRMVTHPTFNRNPYNWYIKPYHWVDDHPLLYGNNGSLDPSTFQNQTSKDE